MRPGWIYVFARTDGIGDVKVGVSGDPHERLYQVRPQAGWFVAAAWYHQNPYKVEAEAHRILREFMTQNEWFSVPKYVAFEAVTQAMHRIDGSSNWVPEQPEAWTPPPPPLVPIKVYLKGKYRLPPPAKWDNPDAWVHGYARTTDRAKLAPQYQWLRSSGIPETRIYLEKVTGGTPDMDLMLKDCRRDDVVVAWSPLVFEPNSAGIAAEIGMKGASIVYAMQENPQ